LPNTSLREPHFQGYSLPSQDVHLPFFAHPYKKLDSCNPAIEEKHSQVNLKQQA